VAGFTHLRQKEAWASVAARAWKPAVACPQCGYANDDCCCFCQNCEHVPVGRRRNEVRGDHLAVMKTMGSKPIPTNLEYVRTRLSELDACFRDAPSYKKALSASELELEDFFLLNRNVVINTATPVDVLAYLVSKDLGQKVRTVVHTRSCPELGSRTRQKCRCPSRMNWSSLDSLIGKLRRIFNDAGRVSDWAPESASGNPCASRPVREYLKAIKREQSMAGVTPNQAVPFFRDKLIKLCHYLSQELRRERERNCGEESALSLSLIRDRAFFCLDLHTCKRGGDLCKLTIPQTIRLPDNSGFLFNMTISKTIRDGSVHSFGARRKVSP